MKICLSKTSWQIRSSPSLRDSLDNLRDGNYVVSVDKEKKTRSPNQNRFYFWIFLPYISKEAGYTVEELHDMFKESFLPREKKDPKSIKKKLPMKRRSEYKTTTSLDTVEWEEYIQKIRDTIEPVVGRCPVPNE